MQLGLALPQYGWGHPRHVADFAKAAEELGYDSLWVGDRLLTPTSPSDPYPGEPKPYPPEFTAAADPFVIWSAAAAVTSKIRLGSSTVNAPWYNGPLLARLLTTIDALSGGRLDVGLGTSWMRDEYTAAGSDWQTRGRRLDETLDLLEAWWTDNPVTHVGEFFSLPASTVDLRPAQPGGPAIYLAGMSQRAMERVGRRADGYLALADVPADVQTALWDTARRTAESVGRDPDRLKRIIRMNPHESDLADLDVSLTAWEKAGFDAVFVDLTYCASDVNGALDLADQLMSRRH